MCYYSAEKQFREAKEDDLLVVKKQRHGTKWLVSPDDPSRAVCLKDETRVELLYIPGQTQKKFSVGLEARATFKLRDWWRRDVFALANRKKVSLERLLEGQVIRVLRVPGLSVEHKSFTETLSNILTGAAR